jgi:glucose dehydrogenase
MPYFKLASYKMVLGVRWMALDQFNALNIHELAMFWQYRCIMGQRHVVFSRFMG